MSVFGKGRVATKGQGDKGTRGEVPAAASVASAAPTNDVAFKAELWLELLPSKLIIHKKERVCWSLQGVHKLARFDKRTL
jgi:hypothetical protein